jgi:hypothetical protein
LLAYTKELINEKEIIISNLISVNKGILEIVLTGKAIDMTYEKMRN